ncbi:RNA polymerase I-specific transcription initiation factor RRN3 [Backusella circina FSU 941]|nr:RNA polymerase I-specific transcription initiation factor RRN3 [Backusella circina FSU 941]
MEVFSPYKLLCMSPYSSCTVRSGNCEIFYWVQKGNSNRYNELIEILTRDPSNPEAPSTLKLYIWITVLTQSVSLLDKSCSSLVEAILQIDWSFRSQTFVNAYVYLLKTLVSAHAFYIVPVLNSLVQGFRYRSILPPNPCTTRTGSYERYHQALQGILQLIPTGVNSLFVSLVRYVPHQRFNSAEHAAYIKNILSTSEYVPVLRKQILGLVVDQMVQIDAHIQIELDETEQDVDFDVYNMNFDENYDSEDSDDESDDSDMLSDDGSIDSDASGFENETNDSLEKIKYMVRKLDAMMSLSFQHLAKCIQKGSLDIQDEIFYALVDIFDRTVLKTLKSRYTQFLLFYFCSSNVNVYSEYFLDHLIQHITDPLKPNVTRAAASSYISSYVARAKFLEPSTIQRVVLTLTTWCNSYVDQNESNLVSLDSTKHDVFYAVVQAIMYIFCFRWRDMVMSNDDLEIEEDVEHEEFSELTTPSGGSSRHWCLGLRNLPRLVMSRFNPLKLCSSAVVRQFAKLAHSTHFMYIYPVLEKNKDIFVPGLGGSNLMQAVQSFFPFDPYKLEGSRAYVDNIYFEWIAEEDEEDDSDSEDDDEEDEEVTNGMMAMSISPSPTHFLQ